MDHYIARESALKDYSNYLLKYEKNVYDQTYNIICFLEKLEWNDRIYDKIVDLLNELIKKINIFIEDIDSNAFILDKMYNVLLNYSKI